MKHCMRRSLALLMALLIAVPSFAFAEAPTVGVPVIDKMPETVDETQMAVTPEVEPPVDEAGEIRLGDFDPENSGEAEGLTVEPEDRPEELPEAPAPEAQGFEQAVRLDDAIIIVTAGAGIFPEDASLRVEKADDAVVAQAVEAIAGSGVELVHRQYIIEVLDEAGNACLPDCEQGAPAVWVAGLSLPEDARVALYDDRMEAAREIGATVDAGANVITFNLADGVIYDIFTVVPPMAQMEERVGETVGEIVDEPAEMESEDGNQTDSAAMMNALAESAEKTVCVSFTHVPETAVVTVYPVPTEAHPEPEPIGPEADGSFLLPLGSYTYSAEAEGYQPIVNEPIFMDPDGQPMTVYFEMTPIKSRLLNGFECWEDLQSAIDAAEYGDTLALGDELCAEDADGMPLRIPAEKSVVLDLNGYTLCRDLSTPQADGCVIIVEGSLTLRDAPGGGAVTGGNNAGNGGGVYVARGGRLTVDGADIVDNYASGSGGGIYAAGALTVLGGAIQGNTADEYGGGVAYEETFDLRGGGIVDNVPQDVCLDKPMQLRGDATVSNALISSGSAGYSIGVTGALTGASIGLSVSDGLIDTGYLQVTQGLNAHDEAGALGGMENFSLLNGGNYSLALNAAGELVVGGFVDITLYAGDGSDAAQTVRALRGSDFEMPECPFASPDGKSFQAWLMEDGTILAPGETISVTEETFATAQWSTTWSGFQALIDAAQWSDTLKLPCDLTRTEANPSASLTIPQDKKLTLDLAGHALDGAGLGDSAIICVEGTLTLIDSVGGGRITGGGAGGVAVNGGSFTLQSGEISGNNAPKLGGGVLVTGGEFVMAGGTISGNASENGKGGGVGVSGGSFELKSGRIQDNKAALGGGVAVTGGKAILTSGSIASNGAASGGGVSVQSSATLELTGTSISNNTASANGGGLMLESGASVSLTGGDIDHNSAGNMGGGIYGDQAAFAIDGTDVTENSAAHGGGVAVSDGTFALNLGGVRHNTATDNGGGLYIQEGSINLAGGSVSGNRANRGGGAFLAEAALAMPKNIITDNAAGQGGGLALSGATLDLPAVACVRNNRAGEAENNYWLQNGAKFNVAEKLSEGYTVYLAAEMKAGAETLTIASGEKLSRDNFICTDGVHVSSRNLEGDVLLGLPLTVRFTPGAGSGTMADDTAVRGGAYTLPSGRGLTPPEGEALQGWKIVKSGYWDTEIKGVGYNLPVTDDMLDSEGALNLEAQWGQGTLYVDENGTTRTATLVVPLTEYQGKGAVTLSSGWYLADGATFDARVTVDGDVNIIVDNAYTTTMKAGILLPAGCTLSIWGEGGWQRSGGRLVANGGESCAGIGGVARREPGTFILHSGVVEAQGGSNAAGIGGGDGTGGAVVLIHGGKLTARGGESGAGIGGGLSGSQGGQVSVYGGTVYAYGGNNAAGIGGGKYNSADDGKSLGGNGAQVTIVGATVYAQGGASGAGIGGGWGGSGGSVTIGIGSTLTAVAGINAYAEKASDQAQGIGRGFYFARRGMHSGSVTLTDTCQVEAGESDASTQKYTGDACIDACRMAYARVVDNEALPTVFSIVSEGVDDQLAAVSITRADDLGKTVAKASWKDKMAVTIRPVGQYNHYDGITIAYTYHGATHYVEDYDPQPSGNDTIVYFDMPMGNVTVTPKIKTDTFKVNIRVLAGKGSGQAYVNNAMVTEVPVGRNVEIRCTTGGDTWFLDVQQRDNQEPDTYTPRVSYQEKGKTVIIKTEGVEEDENTRTFTMPPADVTVELTFREAVFYYDEHGVRQKCKYYHSISAGDTEWNAGGLENYWYYLGQSMKLSNRVKLGAEIHLILGAGVTLDCPKGLRVNYNDGGKLYLYESVKNGGSHLKCDASDEKKCAGIGGNDGETGGTVVIIGGKVTAKGGKYAAGIGGGNHGALYEYRQYGGTVTAEGGKYGAGVGGGEGYDGSVEDGIKGEVQIHGGSLTANGGAYAAGIGGGQSMHQGKAVYIHGGTVKATGGRDGAGIGGGEEYDPWTSRQVGANGGDVFIYGGTVTATGGGGDGAAGIGGGQDGKGGHFTMTGGTVTAKAGDNAAGIGGQDNDGGDVDISGGWLYAYGGKNGAGIGGAQDHKCGTINITGGDVTAVGGSSAAGIGTGGTGKGGTIKITGGVIHAEGGKNAAGIGGGGGSSGGTVDAIYLTGYCNVYAYGDYHAVGVGKVTWWGDVTTKLWLTHNCTVKAGNSKGSADKVAPSDKRHSYCFDNKYAEIINCDHSKMKVQSYQDYDANQHKAIGICRYCKCNLETRETHEWYLDDCVPVDSENHRLKYVCKQCSRGKDGEIDEHYYGESGSNVCQYCGYEHGDVTVHILPGELKGAEPIDVTLDYNTRYPLPDLPWDANGWSFWGWGMENDEVVYGIGDEFVLKGDMTITAIWGHTHDGIEYMPWVPSNSLPSLNSDKVIYYLVNDVTLSSTWDPYSTKALCLNGHTITVLEGDAIVIGNGGNMTNLTIYDEGGGCIRSLKGNGVTIYGNGTFTLKGGTITGAKDGVCVTGWDSAQHLFGTTDPDSPYRWETGTFNMEGGAISGCAGSGVRVYSAGLFNLSGGRISGCSNGGVTMTDRSPWDYWDERVAFNRFSMTGGSIEDNSTNGSGGGVCIGENCTFEMTGGRIAANRAAQSGGGVQVPGDDAFFVEGSVVISDNKANGRINNVSLPRDARIGVSGPLTDTSSIGVSVSVAPTASAPVTITKGLTGKGTAGSFKPDMDEYSVRTVNGEAAMGYFDTAMIHYDANGGTGSMPDEPWPKSGRFIVPECAFTGPRQLTFVGWRNVNNSALLQPGDALTDNDNITLRAEWADIHDGVTYEPWTSSDSLPTRSGHYYLTQDVYIDKQWSVKGSDTDIHLCLNGYAIHGADRHAFSAVEVTAWGELTLCDHTGEGYIENTEDIYGVEVYSNSVFTLQGGIIDGMVLLRGGRFEMKGGTACGVTEDGNGGRMAMSGGLVTKKGVNGNLTFTMTGGTITGCADGGLNVLSATLSGCTGASITGNTLDGVARNVYLKDGAKLRIGDALDESARFGVTAERGAKREVVITSGLKGSGAWQCFIPDDGISKVLLNDGGEVALRFHVDALTVRFDPNGGSGSMAPVTVTPDTTYTLPQCGFAPPKDMQFVGWQLDGAGETLQPGEVIDMIEDVTLKAAWRYNYSDEITFVANGGSGTMPPVSVAHNTYYTLPECGFGRPTNKAFVGWLVNDGTQWRKPGETIRIEGATTLKACWNHVHDGIEFKPWYYNTYLPQTSGNYYLTEDVDMNHTYWSLRNVDIKLCLNGKKVKNIGKSVWSEGVLFSSGAKLTLYDCTDEGDFGCGNSGVINLCYNSSNSVLNLVGGGCSTKIIMVSGEQTFNMSGGRLNGDVELADRSTFNQSGGCYIEGTVKLWSGTTYKWTGGTHGNVTIVDHDPNWSHYKQTEPVVNVRFDANGGSGAMDDLRAAGGNMILPDCGFTAPMGMGFVGWALSGDADALLQPGETIALSTDVTIRAMWGVAVRFDANGGSGEMNPVYVVPNTEYTLPLRGFNPPLDMKLAGWQFGNEIKQPGERVTITKAVTLKAAWKPLQYEISFDANGGSGTMKAVTIDSDSEYTLPECGFTASGGLTFGGWLLDNARYDAGQTIQPTDSITLTASWQEVHDGITFEGWPAADRLPTKSGNYSLMCDVTLNKRWMISGYGAVVNLCLNGHSIRGADGNAFAIIDVTNWAKLNIYDHTGAGTIEDDENDDCVIVYSNSVFTLYGGTLKDRVLLFDGRFDLKGGTACGVTEEAGGVMNMSGGLVTRRGVSGDLTFTMTGGTITGCTDGGLNVLSATLSGCADASITGNTLNGVVRNVYLKDGAKLHIGDGLNERARFGISTEMAPVKESPVVITEGLNRRGTLDSFAPDDDNYIIKFNGDGEAALCLAAKLTFDANGGSGEMADVTWGCGISYTLPECGFTAPKDMKFAGWQIGEDSENVKQAGEVITVAEALTLKARWTLTAPAFRTHSLLLTGEIGVNFFMALPEIEGVDYSDAYMEFTVESKNGAATRAPFDPEFTDVSGRGYYGFSVNVNAIQMAAPIHAVFHYGDGQTVRQTYTVKDYIVAYETVSKRYDAATTALVHALADYGHYAQPALADYNGWSVGKDYAEMDVYYTGNLDVDSAYAAVADQAMSTNRGTSEVEKFNYTLNLLTQTEMRVIVTLKSGYTGGATYLLDGQPVQAEPYSGGRYAVKIKNIPAHRLDDTHTLAVTTKSGTATATLSPLTYVRWFLKDSRRMYQESVAALYYYYKAAEGYRAAHP